MELEMVTLVGDDYDEAVTWFVEALGFELGDGSPATTNDGRPKRWVVVPPPRCGYSWLERTVRPNGDMVGNQAEGRVGFSSGPRISRRHTNFGKGTASGS